jgi:triphosphatase
MTRLRQQTETELKLMVPPAAENRLDELPAFKAPAASEPCKQRIVTTYFDTPGCDLAREGLSLRVRRVGEKRVQTVKATGTANAAMARGEWEWPIATEAPDLSLIEGTPIGSRFLPGASKSLEPAVITDVVRTTRVVRVEGGVVDVALDDGVIAAGDACEPIHELELELREGGAGALYRLALALHAKTPVAVGAESKVNRGLRLRAGVPAKPRDASRPEP